MNRCKVCFLVTVIVNLLVLGCECAAVANEIDGAEPVYFSLVISSATHFNTSGVVEEVDRTLELLAKDTTILPGYRLQYSRVLDTQVKCNLKCMHTEAAMITVRNETSITACAGQIYYLRMCVQCSLSTWRRVPNCWESLHVVGLGAYAGS